MCAEVVNCWLKRGIILNDNLHGFREGRGMGTATLESKLARQISGISHKPIFQVFIEVQKAYDSLDRGEYLGVLRKYGMAQNLDRLLNSYWYHQRIVPKTSKFLGKYFRMVRGVT